MKKIKNKPFCVDDARKNLLDLQDVFLTKAINTSGSIDDAQTPKYLVQYKIDEILNKISYSLNNINGSLSAFPADFLLILNERNTANFEKEISNLEQDIPILKSYYACLEDELPSTMKYIKDKSFALNLLSHYEKIIKTLQGCELQSATTKDAVVDAVKLGIINKNDKNLKNAVSLINDFDSTQKDLLTFFSQGVDYTYKLQDELASDLEILQVAADAGCIQAKRTKNKLFPEPLTGSQPYDE